MIRNKNRGRFIDRQRKRGRSGGRRIFFFLAHSHTRRWFEKNEKKKKTKSVYRLCNDTIGSLSNDDGDGNKNGEKSYWFKLEKQQLCTCITLFCTFLCRRRTNTRWKCLISSFVEDVKMTSLTFLAKTEEENAAFQAVDFLRIGQKRNGKYRLRSRPRI